LTPINSFTRDDPGVGREAAQQFIAIHHLEIGKVEPRRHGAADQGIRLVDEVMNCSKQVDVCCMK